MNLYAAFYDMDTNCVYAYIKGGIIRTIDCSKVENAFVDNLYERSELNFLLDNDPMAYAELVLYGNPRRYLKEVTLYRPVEAMM